MQSNFLNLSKPHKIKIHYTILGEGSALIFLNGATASHIYYQDLLEILAKYFKVYAFTLPGFRGSTKLNKLSVDNYLKVIDEFVNTFHLNDFILAGHSFGGGLALAYASKYSVKIKAVVAISPFNAALNQKLFETIKNLSNDNAVRNGYKGYDGENLLKRNLRKLNEIPESLRLFNFLNPLDLTEYFHKHNKKVIILVSGKDKVISKESQLKIKDKINNAEFIIFKNEGHYLPFSKKEDLVEIIRTLI